MVVRLRKRVTFLIAFIIHLTTLVHQDNAREIMPLICGRLHGALLQNVIERPTIPRGSIRVVSPPSPYIIGHILLDERIGVSVFHQELVPTSRTGALANCLDKTKM